MRVFVAGATGAIGKRLIPLLVEAGHSVTGMTRSESKALGIRHAGADAAVAEALSPAAVHNVVRRAKPEVIVHELTSIPADLDLRRFGEQFETTNRLPRRGQTICSRQRRPSVRDVSSRKAMPAGFSARWRSCKNGRRSS